MVQQASSSRKEEQRNHTCVSRNWDLEWALQETSDLCLLTKQHETTKQAIVRVRRETLTHTHTHTHTCNRTERVAGREHSKRNVSHDHLLQCRALVNFVCHLHLSTPLWGWFCLGARALTFALPASLAPSFVSEHPHNTTAHHSIARSIQHRAHHATNNTRHSSVSSCTIG